MKFNLEVNAGSYQIRSYEIGQISVSLTPDSVVEDAPRASQETLRASLIIMPHQLVRDWPPQCFEGLLAQHFEIIAALQPEVVLFGSGARLRYPDPSLTASLLNQGIGVEIMDTGAACRTYNILLAEGRNVAAALLIIQPGP